MATTLVTGSVRGYRIAGMRFGRDIDDLAIRCAECNDGVDEFTVIAKGWRYFCDGTSLLAYCPECARREFAPDDPPSGVVPLVHRRGGHAGSTNA